MYIKWVKTNKQTNIILLLFTLQLFKNLCCYDQHNGLFMSNTGIKNVQVVCSAWLEHGSRETSDKISQELTLSLCSYCWRSLYSLYCGLALQFCLGAARCPESHNSVQFQFFGPRFHFLSKLFLPKTCLSSENRVPLLFLTHPLLQPYWLTGRVG